MARRPRLDRELERYLVADETVIVSVRRHWFHLSRPIAAAIGATFLAFWVDVNVPLNPGGRLLHNLSWVIWWVAIGWLVWEVANWRRDWFVATDKRFLLFYGFIRRKVAMMPLLKVTDMTYDRSPLARIVGYGTFRLESAGQEQAMSTIDHVPDADRHYRAICTQLFGPGSQIRFQPGLQPPPSAPPPGPPPPPGGGSGGGGRGGPYAGGPHGADPYAAVQRPGEPYAGAGPAHEADDEDRWEDDWAEPAPREDPGTRARRAAASFFAGPASWYRSSNLPAPADVGDTGEIPVVEVPNAEPEDQWDAGWPGAGDNDLRPVRRWVD